VTRHGRHWPREEQNANAFEGFGDLSGDPAAAARVVAAWAPTLPPYEMPIDPARPEFDNVGRRTDG
jgi:hypothetical protein